MFLYLLLDVLVITHDNHAVAPMLQLAPHQFITHDLVWVIMHRPVTKETDIRSVEKVGNAVRFRHRLLRLVWQAQVSSGEGIEEAAFEVRAGIGERVQPGEVGSPVAPADAGLCTTSHKVLQGLPNAVTVEL
jgi:hypothetical protein